MAVFPEGIVMGWCPQKDFESMQFQTCASHAPISSVNPIVISSKPIERMDIPLDGIGNRSMITLLFALYMFLMGISLFDHLNRTFTSYLAVVLTSVAFIRILFLLDHKKITFDSEIVRIQVPFLKARNFQMNDIASVRTVDNIMYKQVKMVYIVCMASIAFFVVKAALDLYSLIIYPMAWEESTNIGISMLTFFILTFLLYRSYRRSRYPQVIKIDVGNKKITLSPRNELEYDMLREKLGQ